MKVIASGRTDHENYFRSSGIREHKKLPHTPFLAFVTTGDTLEVVVVDSAKSLLGYPDDIQVMAQWMGEWKSDFFQFRVGDFRRYIEAHPPEKHQVV